jgi:hypothetical protein
MRNEQTRLALWYAQPVVRGGGKKFQYRLLFLILIFLNAGVHIADNCHSIFNHC